MKLPPAFEPLFNQAWSFVRRFIQDQDGFVPFALTIQTSGELVPVQMNEEVAETEVAIGTLLSALIPMASSGQITATAMCIPIPGSTNHENVPAVVFDMEINQNGRFLAVMQYSKTEKHGWNFGPIEYLKEVPRLFA